MKILSVTPLDEERLVIVVNAPVPAYKANKDGMFVHTESDSFSISFKDLARQLYPLSVEVAMLRAIEGRHFSSTQWIRILTGAEIEVDFDFHTAGEEIDEYTVENTGYTKTIKKFNLSELSEQLVMAKLAF